MDKIVIGFVLGLFSSLFVFYITERIKYIKENRQAFYRLSILLNENYITLNNLKSSLSQYISIVENYKLKDYGSISFPAYNLKSIIECYPSIAYGKEEVYLGLRQIESIIFNLNSSLSGLLINEIKNNYLSGQVNINDTEERFKNELIFVKNIYEPLESYIEFFLETQIKVNLINKNNTKMFLLNLTLKFSEKQLQEEKILLKEHFGKYGKVEEFKYYT